MCGAGLQVCSVPDLLASSHHSIGWERGEGKGPPPMLFGLFPQPLKSAWCPPSHPKSPFHSPDCIPPLLDLCPATPISNSCSRGKGEDLPPCLLPSSLQPPCLADPCPPPPPSVAGLDGSWSGCTVEVWSWVQRLLEQAQKGNPSYWHLCHTQGDGVAGQWSRNGRAYGGQRGKLEWQRNNPGVEGLIFI